MKNFVVTKILNNMNRFYNYDEVRTAELKYGIETIYLTLTKTIVILTSAYFLKIFKELLLILIFYSLLRATGFGVHAKKPWHCWISSLIIFLGVPIIMSTAPVLPISLKITLCAIFSLIIFIFAPADTEKRPIINKKRRLIYKILCTSTAITYSFISIFTSNIYLSNALIFSLIIEALMILPITYKLFSVKFDNYKNYLVLTK